MKDENAVLGSELSQADIVNMAFATTMITNGHAKGIVTKTGMETRVGSIAKAIIEDEAPQTPIQRKLEEVRKKFRRSLSYSFCAYIYNRSV